MLLVVAGPVRSVLKEPNKEGGKEEEFEKKTGGSTWMTKMRGVITKEIEPAGYKPFP